MGPNQEINKSDIEVQIELIGPGPSKRKNVGDNGDFLAVIQVFEFLLLLWITLVNWRDFKFP